MLDVRVKLEMYEGKKVGTKSPSPKKEVSARRMIEELKDKYSDIQTNIEIYEVKKKALEGELAKMGVFEKQKHFAHLELEKENRQVAYYASNINSQKLRTEIDIIMKENDTTVQAGTKLADTSSYQDLLKDFK